MAAHDGVKSLPTFPEITAHDALKSVPTIT